MTTTQVLYFCVCVTSIFAFTKLVAGEESELVQVHLLYRHGDRTPINFYPTDPYSDLSNWPDGLGQLINKGKERHFKVGQYFRRKYDDLLPINYHYSDVFIRSTDVDRTLMSAYCDLAGLYPPIGNQIWNINLTWQPIPVHTVAKNTDKLLRDNADCPQADLELKKVESSIEIQSILKDNKKLLDYLTENTGQEFTTLQNVAWFHDTVFIEEQMNFTLPNWTHSVYPEKTRPLSAAQFAINSHSDALRRFRGGPLLKETLEQMYNVTEGLSDLKMVINSAHDTTISMFLSTLGVFDPQIPSYASVVIMELRKKKENYFVKVFYLNKTDEILKGEDVEPCLLTIPGCEPECPFDQFRSVLSPWIPDDWEKECGLSQKAFQSTVSSGVLTTLLVVGFILLLAVVVGLTLYNLRRHKEDAYLYKLLSGNDNL